MAEAEAKAKVRYVYVRTTLCLWRFDLQGTDINYKSSGKNRGSLTKLIDFRQKLVPLGAGGFVWNSKLFFVGGEMVKPDTPRVLCFPRRAFDNDQEFDSIYKCKNCRCDPLGFIKLPRSSLNKRVFVFSNRESNIPSISISGTESGGHKTWPLVVPIKKGDKTLVYVIAKSPLLYKFRTSLPSFEVYEPALDSWEQLDEPPYSDRFIATFFPAEMAFELAGKIFLFSGCSTGLWEMCFDVEDKKWESSRVFFGKSYYVPTHMIRLSGDVYLGCKGFMILAYKYCPGSPIGIQTLGCLSLRCLPKWRHSYEPSSELCHLGDGLVLFACTAMAQSNRDYLRFHFVRFQITILSKDDSKYKSNNFVSYRFVDSFDKRVHCGHTPLIYSDSILNLYLL